MKIKVLLADDEQAFRETFFMVLKEEGMDVTAVADGLAVHEGNVGSAEARGQRRGAFPGKRSKGRVFDDDRTVR